MYLGDKTVFSLSHDSVTSGLDQLCLDKTGRDDKKGCYILVISTNKRIGQIFCCNHFIRTSQDIIFKVIWNQISFIGSKFENPNN